MGHSVRISGLEMAYFREGQGPDVLFLHGWGVGHAAYRPLLEHLSRRFTVTAPDLPGFGETAEPDRPWDASDYADLVLGFVKELNLCPTAALGHSNGGRILLELCGARDNVLAN